MTNTTTKDKVGRVMSPLVRFDYVKIFEPRTKAIGSNQELPEEKWAQEMVCMFPKQLTDPKDIAAFDGLKGLIQSAAREFYPDLDINGRKPDGSPLIKLPLLDGDAYNQSKGGKVPQYTGMIYFSVRSIGKKFHITPAQIDASGQIVDIHDKRELYSGCWGKVMVTIYPNAKGTPPGLNFGLSSMLKIKDDTPLFSGGAGDAAKDFAEVAADPANRPNNSQMFDNQASGGLNLGF